MKKAWGREPAYPSDLSADRDGGVVVHDFQGDPPIVRMNADGTIRAQVKPRLKEGRTIDLRDAQVAPDGVLWVSDGHTLYRLESGLVGRVLGEAPDSLRLDQAAAVTMDGKGRIYAVVGRTGAAHGFGPDGTWLHVCVPDASDVPDELREKVYLIDEKGAVFRTITRRADGLWLERPETAATAPDGSNAVVSGGKQMRMEGGELAVSLYSPQAEPILTFPLPKTIEWSFPRIAYDGKHFVLTGDKAIVVFDASGKPLGQFIPAQSDEAWWTPFRAPDGRGLLLFDGANRSPFRAALNAVAPSGCLGQRVVKVV